MRSLPRLPPLLHCLSFRTTEANILASSAIDLLQVAEELISIVLELLRHGLQILELRMVLQIIPTTTSAGADAKPSSICILELLLLLKQAVSGGGGHLDRRNQLVLLLLSLLLVLPHELIDSHALYGGDGRALRWLNQQLVVTIISLVMIHYQVFR